MKMQLVTMIEEVFRNSEYPSDGAISVVTSDDEGTTEHFSGTHWKDHSGDTLANFSSSITFLTPEAFAYFLPAFMIAALDQPFGGIASSLLVRICPPKFDPHRPSYSAWWSRLDRSQQESVVEFLRKMRASDESVPDLAISALESYVAV